MTELLLVALYLALIGVSKCSTLAKLLAVHPSNAESLWNR